MYCQLLQAPMASQDGHNVRGLSGTSAPNDTFWSRIPAYSIRSYYYSFNWNPACVPRFNPYFNPRYAMRLFGLRTLRERCSLRIHFSPVGVKERRFNTNCGEWLAHINFRIAFRDSYLCVYD